MRGGVRGAGLGFVWPALSTLLAVILAMWCVPATAAAATLYVDNPGDFIITTDQGAAGLDAGDTVTFNPSGGTQTSQAGLIYGTNAFGTIQSAVNAAGTGDTIDVAGGTFTEPVTVSTTVTLRGNQAGVDARTRTSVSETVVNNPGGSFLLLANSIVLDGFAIQDNTNSSFSGAGIFSATNVSGFQIRNDIVQHNIIGIVLYSSGAIQTVVEQNAIRDNDNPGGASGNGLLSDAGLSNALIRANRFSGDHPNAGLVLSHAGTPVTTITAADNQFEDGNAAAFFNVDNSTITGNTFSGILPNSVPTNVALILGGGDDSDTISGNTFISTDLTSFPRTVIAVSDLGFGFGNNSTVTISNNAVTLNASALPTPGIAPLMQISDASGASTISNNTVTVTGPSSGALTSVAALRVHETSIGTLDVTNNTFHGGLISMPDPIDISSGILIDPASPSTMTLRITGNTLDGWVHGIQSGSFTSSATVDIRGNHITANVGNGIEIFNVGGHRIRENEITGNGKLGIDLGGDGITFNDAGDADTGANRRQNFPVLTSAETKGGVTQIAGTLNSLPSATFHIELFANAACDPSGYGEGQTFLGGTDVTTDATGNGSFVFAAPTAIAAGQAITATATASATNDTSEFSACFTVRPVGISVIPTSGLTTTEAGGTAAFGVVLTSVPSSTVTIALSSSKPTEGTMSPATLTFTPANALSTQLVTVTGVDDGVVDGNVTYSIVTAPAASADPLYSGLDASDVALTNVDNDVAPVTPTPTPIACTPRPEVRVEPVTGSGALRVTIAATPLNTRENNSLQELRFGDPSQGVGDPQNARVTLNGQVSTGRFTYAVPPGVHEVTFTVERIVAGQPTTVPLLVVDSCGPWKTFVGGGTAAGF